MIHVYFRKDNATVETQEVASKTDNIPNASSSTLLPAELSEPNVVEKEQDNELVVLVGQELDNTHESKLEPSTEADY